VPRSGSGIVGVRRFTPFNGWAERAKDAGNVSAREGRIQLLNELDVLSGIRHDVLLQRQVEAPSVRHERRRKGREAAFGTSVRWGG